MKNKTTRLALIVLMLAIVTISIISGTLAKYVETVSGTDSARVAKFEYSATAGGTTLGLSPVEINLFNTVNDEEVYDPSGANKNGDDKLVAPGTYGHFDVVATNKSEVEVAVTYDITETNNNNVPIVYFIKAADASAPVFYSDVVPAGSTVALGTDIAAYLNTLTTDTISASTQVTVAGDLAAMSTALGTTMEATDNAEANKITKTDNVGWFWAFGDATNNVDSSDTTLGKAGTATVTANIGVTFTQVD